MIDLSTLPGELTLYERRVLYDTVLKYQPKLILEVGTGFGGATATMAEALKVIGSGQIYTCDPKRKPKKGFFKQYDNIVEYFELPSVRFIKFMREMQFIPDMIFFDGPEDARIAILDFAELEDHLKPGTVFCMHDWETSRRKYDNGVSVKSVLMKKYLHDSESLWDIQFELDALTYKEGEESVGLVCAIKR